MNTQQKTNNSQAKQQTAPKATIRIAAGATPYDAYRRLGFSIPQSIALTRRYIERKARKAVARG